MRIHPSAAVIASLVASACVHAHYTGPVIDVHAHILPEAEKTSLNDKLAGDAVTLLREMDRAHVQMSSVITIARRGELEVTRANNDRVIGLAKAQPDRFFAFASVHPDDEEEALRELERVAQAGARGLKLHPNTQTFDVASPNVDRVFARAGELGLVVLVDGWNPFDADQTGKLAKLAIAHPKTRMIIAHLAGARFLDLLLFHVLEHYSFYAHNVWFDLSAVATLFARSPYAEQVRWLGRQLGVDHLLFGSDFPLFSPAAAIDDVHALGFTAEEERQIFHDNAARLFGAAAWPK